MNKLLATLVRPALAVALLGGLSVAHAATTSGSTPTSGSSGSSGATIDTGFGGSGSGSSAGSNPGLGNTNNGPNGPGPGALTGPLGLLQETFGNRHHHHGEHGAVAG